MFREIGYHLSASPWSFPFHTLPHVSLCMKSYFTGVLWPTALSSEVRSSLSSNLSPFTHQEILRVRLCGWLLWGVLKCEKMKLNLAAVGYIRQHIYPVCVYKLSPVRQRLLAPNASSACLQKACSCLMLIHLLKFSAYCVNVYVRLVFGSLDVTRLKWIWSGLRGRLTH